MQPVKYYALIIGSALMLAGTSATAAIVDSKHDLGSASTATVKVTGTVAAGTGNDETCVFCHTPHAAADPTVPLWNKNLTTAPTLANTYSSTTIDGTTDFTGSTSMACLSCHDGTQAMDNIVNAPGSGGLTAGGGAGGLGYTWTGLTDGTGIMNAGVAKLGTDLGDDHPVAIQYAGGGLGLTSAATAIADPDFKAPTEAVIGGTTKWWFDTDVDGKMDSSEIRLYSRDIGGTEGLEPFVECASCHDPHKGENATFLRVANTSSAVCTACHSK